MLVSERTVNFNLASSLLCIGRCLIFLCVNHPNLFNACQIVELSTWTPFVDESVCWSSLRHTPGLSRIVCTRTALSNSFSILSVPMFFFTHGDTLPVCWNCSTYRCTVLSLTSISEATSDTVIWQKFLFQASNTQPQIIRISFPSMQHCSLVPALQHCREHCHSYKTHDHHQQITITWWSRANDFILRWRRDRWRAKGCSKHGYDCVLILYNCFNYSFTKNDIKDDGACVLAEYVKCTTTLKQMRWDSYVDTNYCMIDLGVWISIPVVKTWLKCDEFCSNKSSE